MSSNFCFFFFEPNKLPFDCVDYFTHCNINEGKFYTFVHKSERFCFWHLTFYDGHGRGKTGWKLISHIVWKSTNDEYSKWSYWLWIFSFSNFPLAHREHYFHIKSTSRSLQVMLKPLYMHINYFASTLSLFSVFTPIHIRVFFQMKQFSLAHDKHKQFLSLICSMYLCVWFPGLFFRSLKTAIARPACGHGHQLNTW